MADDPSGKPPERQQGRDRAEPALGAATRSAKGDRERRLAAELRANLRKRRAQRQALDRAAGDAGDGEPR